MTSFPRCAGAAWRGGVLWQLPSPISDASSAPTLAGVPRAARPRLPLQQRVSAAASGITGRAARISGCAHDARCRPLRRRVNVALGPKEDRMLITGLHTVADIFCTVCNTNLGWKYEMAFEEGQKYKVRAREAAGGLPVPAASVAGRAAAPRRVGGS